VLDKRYIGNAVQVFFKDGTSTVRVAVDCPIGHRNRRAEGMPLIMKKFEASVAAHYPARQAAKILALFAAPQRIDTLSVTELVAALVSN
jgi:2-methylcitrate dehydratase